MGGADDAEVRLAAVLSDAPFPARRWQLIAHAQYRGADWMSRNDLLRLPARRYRDLGSVLAAIRALRQLERADESPDPES